MVNQFPVTDDILQISNQTKFEKDDRINGFLTTFPIVWLSEFVEKLKIDGTFQPPVKAVFWNSLGQVKGVKQLGLIVFLPCKSFF